MSFPSQDPLVEGRKLAAQELFVTGNLVTAVIDLPGHVVVDSSTIAATTITLNSDEAISKFFMCEVRNRATGASATLTSVAISSGNLVITLDATGLTNVCVHFVYEI